MAFITDIKVSLYSSQVDVTLTREVLAVVCHSEITIWEVNFKYTLIILHLYFRFSKANGSTL